MIKLVAAMAGAVSALTIFAPIASADPDPHNPNGAANWCPGGIRPGHGGQKNCLGTPFADGTFYSQIWSYGPGGPWSPGHWLGSAGCSVWIEGSIQGAGSRGMCGGGPQWLDIP